MNRRRFLAGTATTGLLAGLTTGAGPLLAQSAPGRGAGVPDAHPLQNAWRAWKSAYLLPEGRVVDGYQNDASHSEGQGYGMTLARIFGDADAFERMFLWTEEHLAIRPDALLAWRWREGEVPHVPDHNNASDGDLFYAWALAAAATRFDRPDYAERARRIVSDLVRLCVVPSPVAGQERLLFLPAAQGFDIPGGYVINPSYWMPLAMRELAVATGDMRLSTCAADGEAFIASLLPTGPTPDWIAVVESGWEAPPSRFPFVSGYEAMRVPLFLAWSGDIRNPAVARYRAAVDADRDPSEGTPVKFSCVNGQILERSPNPGYKAIAELVNCALSGSVGSQIPPFTTDQPYYPATLHLFALIAQTTRFPQCVPL